jgi:enoyl-CoA hydratase/carnithine racemase
VANDARLRAPFTGMGFTPDSGASWLIPRLVGVARAKEMLLLGREITGLQAVEWGLVHRSVPGTAVAPAAAELVTELAGAATVAVGLTKLLIQRSLTVDLERHLADEGREFGRPRLETESTQLLSAEQLLEVRDQCMQNSVTVGEAAVALMAASNSARFPACSTGRGPVR